VYRRELTAIAVIVVVAVILAWAAIKLDERKIPSPPDTGYDPGLYTPFTHAPTRPDRPAHPFSIYRPPGYTPTTDGAPATLGAR
jgi:hypothetical protein